MSDKNDKKDKKDQNNKKPDDHIDLNNKSPKKNKKHKIRKFVYNLKRIIRKKISKRRLRPDDKRTLNFQRIKRKCFYKGIILKLLILNPKKPNSAERKAARVKLPDGVTVTAYIPGEIGAKNPYQVSSNVLIRGCKRRDLIGVKKAVVRRGECCVLNRKNARSKYGTPKPKSVAIA